MSTITPVVSKPGDIGDGDGSVSQIQWTLGNADDGARVEWVQYADRSVQVAGSFGGATVVFEGSNDGTNYATLNNAQGTALSGTSDFGPKQIVELPRYVRPRSSGGAGTNVVVTLVMRRQNPMRT